MAAMRLPSAKQALITIALAVAAIRLAMEWRALGDFAFKRTPPAA